MKSTIPKQAVEAALLAIDPGKNASGWALFSASKHLVAAGHDDNGSIASSLVVDGLTLAIERPQVYGGRSAKGDTQDLLDLSLEVGFFCGYAAALVGCQWRLYLPREWKGSTPKTVMHARIIESQLLDTEVRLLPALAKSRMHNMLDAVGLGLVHVGRAKR